MLRDPSSLLWSAFLERAELAGAGVRFHLLDECAAGAVGGEIAISASHSVWSRSAIQAASADCWSFGKLFDRVLDLCEVHTSMLLAPSKMARRHSH